VLLLLLPPMLLLLLLPPMLLLLLLPPMLLRLHSVQVEQRDDLF
jgi:hypothetical protein